MLFIVTSFHEPPLMLPLNDELFISTSSAYPACQLAGYGEDYLDDRWFGIQCGENPGAGSVLVYTMIKNPSGNGALLKAIDLAGPIVPPPTEITP